MTLERIGPYRIVRLLGKGGMGAVYEGLHEAIERRVAIKVLHSELARRADIATRFFNEARAVNRIAHSGLVQVTDHGQMPDGMAYIVMEFLEGETLGQRLKRINTRLPYGEVIRLGRQMASALAAAHDKDIVHRDLKPDNIMIVPNPDVPNGEQIKILDFGIAKVAESQSGISEAHTRADALLGTPRYMSPEQCKGSGGVDAKSDVYSLGIIFYECLAGKPPFPGSAHGELIVQHILQEPPPLAAACEPGVPEPFVQLVHRMLLKERTTRPTMRQVVQEIDRMSGAGMSGSFGVLTPPPGMMSSLPPGMMTPPPGAMGPQLVMQQYPSMPGTGSLPGHQNMAAYASHPSLPGVGQQQQQVPGQTGMPSTLGLSSGQAPVAPRSRWPVAVAVGSLVGAIAVGVVLVTVLNKPHPAQQLPLPPPVVVERKHEPEPPKKMVHWALSSEPAGAMVVRQRDGQVLGITPLSLSNPQGTGSEKVRVVLQGYIDESVTLDLDKDAEQKLDLRPAKGKGKRPKNVNPAATKGYQTGDLTVVD